MRTITCHTNPGYLFVSGVFAVFGGSVVQLVSAWFAVRAAAESDLPTTRMRGVRMERSP